MTPPIYLVGQGFSAQSSFAQLCAQRIEELWQIKPYVIVYPEVTEAVPCTQGGTPLSDEVRPLKQWLAELSGALIISANNTYLFSQDEVNANTIINYHNALLPYHRGTNAHLWSIWEGDEAAGITWHRVDQDIDHGAILVQGACQLAQFAAPVTALDLLMVQHEMAQLLLPLALQALPEFELEPKLTAAEVEAQLKALEPSCQLMHTPSEIHQWGWGVPWTQIHRKRDLPHAGLMDLSWDFATCYRFLRALDGGVFSFIAKPQLEYHGQRYTITRYSCDQAQHSLTLSCRPKCKLQLSFGPHGTQIEEL